MEDATSNITELKAIVERLSRRMEEISILDNNIIKALEKEEDIMEETDQTLSFQDTIHYGVLKINEFIAEKQPPVSPFHCTNLEYKHKMPKINVNLPKLHIQSFNGNPLEWLTFWDSFNNAIHDNDSLNNIDKMNYLKGMLTDDARHRTTKNPSNCYKNDSEGTDNSQNANTKIAAESQTFLDNNGIQWKFITERAPW